MGLLGRDDNGHITQAFPLIGGFNIVAGEEYPSSQLTYQSQEGSNIRINLMGFPITVGVTINGLPKVTVLKGAAIAMQRESVYIFDQSFTVLIG